MRLRTNIASTASKEHSLNDYTEIRCLKGKYWEFVSEDLMEQIPIMEKMEKTD